MNNSLPFGGIGDSGMGSLHGEYGFQTLSHFKAVFEKSPLSVTDVQVRYPPYDNVKYKMYKTVLEV